MTDSPETTDTEATSPEATRAESLARGFLFLAGGVLLSVLVSCACGPTR
jgi:hypothetical protein